MLIRISDTEENTDIYFMKVATFHNEKNDQSKNIKKIVFIVLIISVISIVTLNVINYFINIY